MIRTKTNKAAVIAAAFALALLLASCQSAATAPPDSYTVRTTPIRTDKEGEPSSPQKTYSEQVDNGILTEEPHSNIADTTTGKGAETSTVRKKDDAKATVKTESEDASWSAEVPMLRGISIGDSEAAVGKLYGKHIDSYKLEDEAEAIQVLEYEGFAVGINTNKKVQYIEVYSKTVPAGLSGLRIGDDPETALRALGKPEKQTAYLLTYAAEGALLKLDLDPVKHAIVSIKLLALN